MIFIFMKGKFIFAMYNSNYPKETIYLRKYLPSDCESLAELFFQTVHNINIKDYTKEQVDAWANGNVDLIKWNKSFLKNHTIIAMKNKKIVGFGDISETGYLDRLYVHKDHQKEGVASIICDKLERLVIVKKITTHSSITAKPFFENRGYIVVKEQTVTKNSVPLKNYVMEKIKK